MVDSTVVGRAVRRVIQKAETRAARKADCLVVKTVALKGLHWAVSRAACSAARWAAPKVDQSVDYWVASKADLSAAHSAVLWAVL